MSNNKKMAFVFDMPSSKYKFSQLSAYLANLPWTFLLHSGESEHPDSRFDILVSHPIVTITSHLAESSDPKFVPVTASTTINYYQSSDAIDSQNCVINTVMHKKNPFELLENEIIKIDLHASFMEDIPFQGGAIGLFSYDLSKVEERILPSAQKIDSLPAMSVGIYDIAWIYDNKKHVFKCVIQADTFALAQNRFASLCRSITEIESLKNEEHTFSIINQWQPTITKETYYQQFERVQEALKAGDCYQINLTQAFKATYKGSLWHAFNDLIKSNKAPFSAFCRVPEAVILCASPERFLEVKQGTISTKPIKGTIPRDLDPIEDEKNRQFLQASEKNRAENVMIVDLLRNDIGKLAKPGSVMVPKLFDIESFPAVHHLVSTITADLPDDISCIALLKACFPGGSITGAPKVSAMQHIEDIEPLQRSIYCGSIAYISACGHMDSNIVIRTITAMPEQAIANNDMASRKIEETGSLICFGGGGIVLDSEADDEYAEVYAKLGKIFALWR